MINYMLEGYVLGSVLAEYFGLNPRYFAKVKDKQSLNVDIKVTAFKHIVLVDLPWEAKEYIKKGYTAVALDAKADESEFDYVLPITNKLKVGFYA